MRKLDLVVTPSIEARKRDALACCPMVAMHLSAVNRGGTRGFRPPEVLLRYRYHTTALDMWSVGVCILSIMTARPIFFLSNDDFDAIEEIASLFGTRDMMELAHTLKRNIVFSEDKPRVNIRDLISTLNSDKDLAVDWPDSLYDLLVHCLELNPIHRITAEEALNHDFFTNKEARLNLFSLYSKLNLDKHK